METSRNTMETNRKHNGNKSQPVLGKVTFKSNALQYCVTTYKSN